MRVLLRAMQSFLRVPTATSAAACSRGAAQQQLPTCIAATARVPNPAVTHPFTALIRQQLPCHHGVRQYHCAAAVGSPAASAEHEQADGVDASSSSSNDSNSPPDTAPQTASPAASDLSDALTASGASNSASSGDSRLPEGLAEWQGFLGALWERGFFEEHSSGKAKSDATTTSRDIKKALQQFGRARPDIVLQLPKQLLADLASLPYPEGLTKKTYVALARLKTDTAAAAPGSSSPAVHATGRASTQDVVRVMSGAAYVLEQGLESKKASSGSGSNDAAGVIARCAEAILQLEQQPPDEELIKAATAATATPDTAAYEQHQSVRTAAVSARRAADSGFPSSSSSSSSREGRESRGGRADGRSSSRAERESSSGAGRQARGRNDVGSGSESAAVKFFPTRSDDPAVQHKLRLLKSAPYVEVRQGDWFCGECGAHNYSFKHVCFRCEVPSNSLGSSKVTANDARQLQQIGFGQGVAYEQRPAAVAYTLQVAEAVIANPQLSLPAAAKETGTQKFKPVELPAQPAADPQDTFQGSSSSRFDDRRSSSSRFDDRRSGSSSNATRQRFEGRTADDSSSSRTRTGSGQGAGDDATRPESPRQREWEGTAAAQQAGSRDSGRRSRRDGEEGSSEANAAWDRPRRLFADSEGAPRGTKTSTSSSSSKSSSRTGVADALKDAFAGLDFGDFGSSSSSGSSAVPRQRQPRRQQEQDGEQAAGQQDAQGVQQPRGAAQEGGGAAGAVGSRVRRLRRPAEFEGSTEGSAAAAAAEAEGGDWDAAASWDRSSSSSSRRGDDRRGSSFGSRDRPESSSRSFGSRERPDSSRRPQRSSSAWTGNEADVDDDDLSGWAADYGGIVGERGGASEQRSSQQGRGSRGGFGSSRGSGRLGRSRGYSDDGGGVRVEEGWGQRGSRGGFGSSRGSGRSGRSRGYDDGGGDEEGWGRRDSGGWERREDGRDGGWERRDGGRDGGRGRGRGSGRGRGRSSNSDRAGSGSSRSRERGGSAAERPGWHTIFGN